MALRFAAAAIGGLAFGGATYANRVEAANTRLTDEASWFPNAPDGRANYGVATDDIALDVKKELEQARRIERHYDDHKGKVKNPHGALSYKFQPFKLGEIINLTEETAIFRFLMPQIDDEFRLEACSTLQAQKREGAMMIEQLQRMYTPITPNGTKGYFDILVKKQPQGRMTEHLWSMKAGDSLNFRVVMHKLKYYPNVYENIGMIGTGTGITALLQVIRTSLAEKNDKTKISLLFANPSDHRVLLKGTLDELAKFSEGRFKPYYTVDKIMGPEPWQGFVGYIDAAKVKATMPPPAKKNIILVCGSDQLMNSVCGVPFAVMKPWSSGHSMQPAAAHGAGNVGDDVGGILGDLGYQSEHVYRF